MKFSCTRSLLQAAVSVAAKAASAKSPIPALEGILIETGTDSIKLTGYDLKKGIYTSVEADVAEQGSIVLGARIFGDIVRSLPEGTVTVRTEGNNVLITCENSDFSIIGTDAADYPELPAIDAMSGVKIPQKLLGDIIRQTIFAVSDSEARPVYTGELFELSERALVVVSCDDQIVRIYGTLISAERLLEIVIIPGVENHHFEFDLRNRQDPAAGVSVDSHNFKVTCCARIRTAAVRWLRNSQFTGVRIISIMCDHLFRGIGQSMA